MGKFTSIALMTIMVTTSFAQEVYDDDDVLQTCKNPGYISRDTTILSMMGWGIGLFAGIAVLVTLLENNPDKDTNSTSP